VRRSFDYYFKRAESFYLVQIVDVKYEKPKKMDAEKRYLVGGPNFFADRRLVAQKERQIKT